MLGGGRALLMQLAHPLVAAGVAAHSDFLENPLRRLDRTMRLTLGLVFGTPAEARECARIVNRAHDRVAGAAPGGTPYRAGDPGLLLWVHATLVDSALVTYETFVAPLSRDERDAYWREAWSIGRLLGIPARTFPPSIEDFDAYVAATVGRLEVGQDARLLAGAVLRPPLRHVPRGLFWPNEVITAGLLPPRLRDQFGVRWDGRRALAYRGLVRTFRAAVRMSPPFLRTVYPARLARRRWQAGGGAQAESPTARPSDGSASSSPREEPPAAGVSRAERRRPGPGSRPGPD